MNKEEIVRNIQNELLKTEQTIKTYQELTQPIAPDVAIGRVSRMDAINNKSVTEAALRQAEQKLKSLHRVLSKIDDPDFGMCLKCKKSIPLARVIIRPESLYCVNCAN